MAKKMAKVRALERGFDNLVIREPGEVFDMPYDDHGNPPKAPWFETVDKKSAAATDTNDLG